MNSNQIFRPKEKLQSFDIGKVSPCCMKDQATDYLCARNALDQIAGYKLCAAHARWIRQFPEEERESILKHHAHPWLTKGQNQYTCTVP